MMNRQAEQTAPGRMAGVLLNALTFYQRSVSPAFGRRCRYLPTCSEYAKTSVERYGAWRGVVMAVRRLLRCQPFGSSGFDPVPPADRGAQPC